MKDKFYERRIKDADVSEQTRYYTNSLRDLVKAFAEHEDINISIIDASATERELQGNQVTTFQIVFVSSELSSNEIDQLMRETIN
jgi:hypothetical protein